jgi:hypothetical protein
MVMVNFLLGFGCGFIVATVTCIVVVTIIAVKKNLELNT